MPGIDLSTLTAPELQQLRRLARGRHDGLLIDRVEWEIAQRAALSSRLGFQVGRPAPVVSDEGEVPLDEVRAFRQPQLELPPPRRSSSLPALAGGLVAGSLITAAAFAGVQGLDGWRLRGTSERPAVQVAAAERTAKPARRPAPRPVVVPAPPVSSTSDAVAGVLAPEPFPPPVAPAPVEVAEIEPAAAAPVVAEAPPPAPPEATEAVAPAEIAKPEAKPEPKRVLAAKDKPKVEAVAKKKDAASKAKATKLAAKKDAKAKAAKTPEKTKELASKTEKTSKTAVAAKKASAEKTKLAAKTKAAPKKPAAKVPAEADDPIGVLLARAERTKREPAAKGAADAAR